MTIAQGYVFCGCLTAAIVIAALWMIGMGVFRRGEAAELDDGAALLLIAIGVTALVTLAVVWAFALSDKIH